MYQKFDCYKLLFIEGNPLNKQHANNYFKMNSTTFNTVICWFFQNTEASRDESSSDCLKMKLLQSHRWKSLSQSGTHYRSRRDLFNETESIKETEATKR